AIALLLAWAALGNLPTNWVGAALLVLGIILVVAEAHTPLMGASAIAGAISFTLGALLLFRPIGSVSPSAPAVALNPLIVVIVAGAAGAFLLAVLPAVVRTRRLKAISGTAVLIGTTGTARGDLAPQGILHIAGEDWSAVTEGDHIRSGEQAQVVRIEGLTLVVRPSSGTEVVPSA
ncbi:MAG TPA: NfeD family protein, partial [Chloroflexota bacterium]